MAKVYEEHSTAVLGEKTLDPWYKRMLLKRLYEEFGENVPETGKTVPAPSTDSAGKPNDSPFLAGLHGLDGSRDKKNPIMTLPYFIPKNHRKPSPEDIYLPPGKNDPPAQIDKSSMLLDARMISDTPPDSFRDELLGLRIQNKAVPQPDAVGGSAGTAGTGFLQGLATGTVGGPIENNDAGNHATQSVAYDNTAGDFSAADHRQERPSPFVQGLQGTNDGNTPRPTPSPTPMPTQTPAVIEPMPGPGPLTDPADMPYGGTYEEQSRAIANSEMDLWEKNLMKDQLDIVFGKSQPAAKQQTQLEIDNATKLKTKVDRINALKKQLKDLDGIASAPEGWKNSIREQIEDEMKQFGKGLAGLDGDFLDPAAIVDIKLNNKDIGNARYENGVATGNLDDIVKGLGGRIVWDGQKNATVYDADGKVVSKILNTAQGFVECDKDGRIVKKCGERGGSVQADVAEYAEKMGVPFSYYHDKNGVFHAYAQPEMRDSPIKVTRKEGDVYIEANVEFVGPKANAPFPDGSGFTYAEVAYAGIVGNWDTKREYNIGGVKTNSNGDPMFDSEGNPIYADDTNKVRLHVKVNCANPSKNKVFSSSGIFGNTIKINIDDSSIFQDLGFTSHVFTLNRDDNFFERTGKLLGNTAAALGSREFERAAYNWSIQNPGEMTLYTRYNKFNKKDIPGSIGNVIAGLVGQGKNTCTDRASFSRGAAHEFGHLLGLGDAYEAFYRLDSKAPPFMPRTNEYGEKVLYEVPKDPSDEYTGKGDMMGGGHTVSNTDVAMLLNAWRTGRPQFFDKTPNNKTAFVDALFNAVKTG